MEAAVISYGLSIQLLGYDPHSMSANGRATWVPFWNIGSFYQCYSSANVAHCNTLFLWVYIASFAKISKLFSVAAQRLADVSFVNFLLITKSNKATLPKNR